MLIVLNRQQCVTPEHYTQLRGTARRITAMLHSLINSLDQATRTPVHPYTRTRIDVG